MFCFFSFQINLYDRGRKKLKTATICWFIPSIPTMAKARLRLKSKPGTQAGSPPMGGRNPRTRATTTDRKLEWEAETGCGTQTFCCRILGTLTAGLQALPTHLFWFEQVLIRPWIVLGAYKKSTKCLRYSSSSTADLEFPPSLHVSCQMSPGRPISEALLLPYLFYSQVMVSSKSVRKSSAEKEIQVLALLLSNWMENLPLVYGWKLAFHCTLAITETGGMFLWVTKLSCYSPDPEIKISFSLAVCLFYF